MHHLYGTSTPVIKRLGRLLTFDLSAMTDGEHEASIEPEERTTPSILELHVLTVSGRVARTMDTSRA